MPLPSLSALRPHRCPCIRRSKRRWRCLLAIFPASRPAPPDLPIARRRRVEAAEHGRAPSQSLNVLAARSAAGARRYYSRPRH